MLEKSTNKKAKGEIKRYGFDIDDVLCDFIPLLIEEYNKIHGTNFEVNDIDTFGFYVYGNSRLEWKELKKIIISKNLYKKVKVIERTKEIINKIIKRGDEVFLITSREHFHLEETTDWLNKNNINYTKLYFSQEKDKLIHSLNLKTFMDDKLETILNISKNCPNTKPILQIKPWNGNKEAFQLLKENKYNDIYEINHLLKRVRVII